MTRAYAPRAQGSHLYFTPLSIVICHCCVYLRLSLSGLFMWLVSVKSSGWLRCELMHMRGVVLINDSKKNSNQKQIMFMF